MKNNLKTNKIMKNIHILPTDKPSRLYITNKSKFGFSKYYLNDDRQTMKNYNIYITSESEDINENDYIITKDGRLVQVSYLMSNDLQGASKVVLTTDQDLIKNGVQAITDEFLEWFVKNPSCEFVEVTYEVLKPFQSEQKGYLIHCLDNEVLEEPKPQTAVEWLVEQLFKTNNNTNDVKKIDSKSIIEQAKEMEKIKDVKYNEMLEMLMDVKSQLKGNGFPRLTTKVEQLIKEATEI